MTSTEKQSRLDYYCTELASAVLRYPQSNASRVDGLVSCESWQIQNQRQHGTVMRKRA